MIQKPYRCGGVVNGTSLLRQGFCAWLRDGCGREYCRGDAMVCSVNTRAVGNLAIASVLTIFLGACGGGMSLPSFSSSSPEPQEAAVAPEMPASIRSDEIVGR